jgi:geranylgeranyl diphosphate synthase type I
VTTLPADLPDRIGAALRAFLDRQRGTLSRITPDLEPAVEAVADFVAGGKRLRPAFAYWGWRGAGAADGPEIITAAASLELLHASALMHDDVMDGSDTRRGMPAVHRRFAALHRRAGWASSADSFGTAAAILLGDLCLVWSAAMLRGCGLPLPALHRGLAVYEEMCTEVMAGQYLDVFEQARVAPVRQPASEGQAVPETMMAAVLEAPEATTAAVLETAPETAPETALETALRVARFKSAKYTVERPLHLGGTLAGGSPELLAAYTAYGIPVGEAFQLRDDLLGVYGDPAQTGKPAGDDLREGKRTVLVALAGQRADRRQAALLAAHLGDPALSAEGVAALREVIAETGALAEVERMIDERLRRGLAGLAVGPVEPAAATALRELAVAATARSG